MEIAVSDPGPEWRGDGAALKMAPQPGPPLSCIPAVVMQKVSQGTIQTENADNADEAEIPQPAYFL